MTDADLAALLRRRVVAGIHTGRLNPGDRLPTYREVAGEAGVDLRAVARAYAALAKEGLVEVRRRSGVFVATQESIGGRVLAETARWMVVVLREAWTRRIRVPDLPEFIRRCVETVQVRCACIESTEDQLTALCGELADDFGLRASPVHADRLAAGSDVGPPEHIPQEVRDSDFLVTTAYHAALARTLAERLAKQVVVVRVNPESIRELERHLAAGELVVVHDDPGFLDRLRAALDPRLADRVRGVLAGNRAALRRIDRSRPVMLTGAARRRLGDITFPHLVRAGPAISAESAELLGEMLVRFNLEAMRQS